MVNDFVINKAAHCCGVLWFKLKKLNLKKSPIKTLYIYLFYLNHTHNGIQYYIK